MAKLSKDLNLAGNITVGEAPSVIKSDKDQIKKVREECIAKDKKMVKGTFVYEEYPGSHFAFKIGPKWKELPIFELDMWDGQEYTIPKWAADWINGRDESKDALNPNSDKITNSCATPSNYYKIGSDGNMKPMADGMTVPIVGQNFKKKMRFIPLTFGE